MIGTKDTLCGRCERPCKNDAEYCGGGQYICVEFKWHRMFTSNIVRINSSDEMVTFANALRYPGTAYDIMQAKSVAAVSSLEDSAKLIFKNTPHREASEDLDGIPNDIIEEFIMDASEETWGELFPLIVTFHIDTHMGTSYVNIDRMEEIVTIDEMVNILNVS